MGASEYAEEINGLQINPLRRLRLRRLIGISLCCKFYPRFRNAQKCLFYVARSHRLRDAPALARTPPTSYGIGHCDPPSVRSPTIRLDAVPESRRQLCTATCLPCIAIPGSGAPGKLQPELGRKGTYPHYAIATWNRNELIHNVPSQGRDASRAAGSVARLRQPETNSEFPSKVGARREQ